MEIIRKQNQKARTDLKIIFWAQDRFKKAKEKIATCNHSKNWHQNKKTLILEMELERFLGNFNSLAKILRLRARAKTNQ